MTTSPTSSLTTLRLIIMTCLLFGAPSVAMAECNADLDCDELNQCEPFESFRIPFSKIKECIKEGKPPPTRWLRAQSVNRGGTGNISFGTLESPASALVDTVSSAIDSGINPFAGDSPSGPSTKKTPDCSSYKSPRLLTSCDIRGTRAPLSDSAPYDNQCGSSIALDHDWAIMSTGATQVALTTPDKNLLRIYRKSGANFNHSSSDNVAIPKFYCELVETPGTASGTDTESRPGTSTGGGSPTTEESPPATHYKIMKIFIRPNTHFSEISSQTRHIPITMQPNVSYDTAPIYNRYIIMSRDPSSGRFKPPAPNPNYFISKGAIAADVDPQCYSYDHLFARVIPKGFGEVLFGNEANDFCQTKTLSPHNFLPEDEANRCMPFSQNYNSKKTTVLRPPATSISFGTIRGATAYSSKTVQFPAKERITADRFGNRYYPGAYIMAPNSSILLSTAGSRINKQTFPGGVKFNIINYRAPAVTGEPVEKQIARIVHVNPPGRIELDRNHRMKIRDGGTVFDLSGEVVRIIPAEDATDAAGRSGPRYIQFDPNYPVEGTILSSIVPPAGSVLPTNASNEATLPYDTRLDLVCEK